MSGPTPPPGMGKGPTLPPGPPGGPRGPQQGRGGPGPAPAFYEGLPLANRGRRLVAVLLDNVPFWIISGIITGAVTTAAASAAAQGVYMNTSGYQVLQFFVWVAWLAFDGGFLQWKYGWTIGKRLMDIRTVVPIKFDSGNVFTAKMTGQQAALWCVGRFIDVLPGGLLLLSILSEKRQTIAEMLSHTIVINKPQNDSDLIEQTAPYVTPAI